MAAKYYAVFSAKNEIRTPLASYCCSSCIKVEKDVHAATTATATPVSRGLDINDIKEFWVVEFQIHPF